MRMDAAHALLASKIAKLGILGTVGPRTSVLSIRVLSHVRSPHCTLDNANVNVPYAPQATCSERQKTAGPKYKGVDGRLALVSVLNQHHGSPRILAIQVLLLSHR